MEYRLISMYTEKFNYKKNDISLNKCEVIPSLKKNTKKIDDENYQIKLMFVIESTEERNTPYNIELVLSGVFQLKGFSEKELDVFLRTNAVQILFPYLRSILSTAMTSLMVQPIFIPIIDSRNISDLDC